MRSHAQFNRGLAKQYDQWMVAMHYAKSTQHWYRKVVSLFIKFLGPKSVASVSHGNIRKFIAQTSEDGATLSTAYRELGVLRLFYDFLHLGGLVSYVAPRFVRLRRPWWNAPAPLSELQVKRLIAATRTLRERALVEFLYATGCRVGETARLNIEDLDFVNRTARVVGKLGKARTVFLTKNATNAIQHYVGDRRTGQVFRHDMPVQKGTLIARKGCWVVRCRDYSGSGHAVRDEAVGRLDELSYQAALGKREQILARCNLMSPRRAGRLDKSALQLLIKTIAKRAGLKKVTPHTLRRTFATHLHEHGAGIEVIQALMGHVWIETTRKYTRISPDRVEKTFERCHPRGKLHGQAAR
jgi:site-specific recombinase XerD